MDRRYRCSMPSNKVVIPISGIHFDPFSKKDGYGDKNVNFKNNYDKWREAVMAFGFGQKFEDTDIYQQSRGNIPSEKFYDKYFGKTGWR